MDKELVKTILEKYESELLEIVKREPWVAEHKYETRDTIVEFNNKFYCISETRFGTYHNGYEYQDIDVIEVVPKEVITIEWRAV